MDQVGGDAAVAELAGQRLGQPDQGRLAHGIEGPARPGDALDHAAADGDDPPAGRQVPGRRLRGQKGRPDVHRESVVDLVQGQPAQRAERAGTGVVHEDVQPAELTDGALDGGPRRPGIGRVRPDRQTTAARRLDLLFIDLAGRLDHAPVPWPGATLPS
jgi:hypothetical protein